MSKDHLIQDGQRLRAPVREMLQAQDRYNDMVGRGTPEQVREALVAFVRAHQRMKALMANETVPEEARKPFSTGIFRGVLYKARTVMETARAASL